MMSEKKVPAIRFRGFEDDWEQRKLSDIYKDIGNAFVGTATPYYVEEGHFYLESNNIKDGLINHNTEVFINDVFYENQKDKWLHTGDMVMVQSGHVGHAAVIPKELDCSAAHALIMFRNPKVEIEPYFLNYQYQTAKSKKKIENITTGNTIKHILASEMQEFIVDVTSYGEQKKIAGFFRDLDNLITLHQCKLEKLKIVKKSMLVNCFPKNGEKVPKFRFSGFTGDWEQRKVGDITIESTEYTTLDAGYPLLTSSRAGLMYQNEYRGNLTTDSKETLFSVVPIGACTYRHMSDDGVFHLNINTLEKGLVSREYPVFFATKENCLNFIIQYINSSALFRAFCAEQKKGGTRTRLYYNALCEFKMMVPSKREQEVIAGYLLSLDHLITLHQRELKKLQMIKKSMLRSMFV